MRVDFKCCHKPRPLSLALILTPIRNQEKNGKKEKDTSKKFHRTDQGK